MFCGAKMVRPTRISFILRKLNKSCLKPVVLANETCRFVETIRVIHTPETYPKKFYELIQTIFKILYEFAQKNENVQVF